LLFVGKVLAEDFMKANRLILAGAAVTIALGWWTLGVAADTRTFGTRHIKHVLLLSIDGMHAVDFYNCANGIAGANDGNPYCPNLAALGETAINYVGAVSSKPSDSFPGMAALITGGTPKSTGIYYDNAYDRTLDPPTITTGNGLAGGSCTASAAPTGTTTEFDEGIDLDQTKLNGGAPGAGLTDGGAASIDPNKLVRDPKSGCAPVWPWNFIRTNTVFGVVHRAGGYTAWIDKHPSYAFVAGPGGHTLDDLYTPEVDSNVVPLPGVTTVTGASCASIRDTSADLTAWGNSFANIQCYDQIKVNALLNQIAGRTHSGHRSAVVPAVFGMNFQSVYYGQSLIESSSSSGGYQNAAALPTPNLMNEIQFVDAAIGAIVSALKEAGIYEDTLVIVSSKHGESPIDPTLYVADGGNSPATLLGSALPPSEAPLGGGLGATEDDVSVLWLAPGASVTAAVQLLESNAALIGLGQIYYGPTLALNYNIGGVGPGLDPRSPDIIVTPNVGVTYVGPGGAIGDHGGFGHDDTNVILLVANPRFKAQTVSAATQTTQVAPTIVEALGLDPQALDAVRAEGTAVLPEVEAQLERERW
jgi:Type I phosphodiesterase / nucleotide pyrophosphatase